MIADIQTGKPNGDLVRSLSVKALPTSENGWPPRPFQIVSLLDMLIRLPAFELVARIHALARLDMRLTAEIGIKGKAASAEDSPQLVERLEHEFEAIVPLLSTFGLKNSAERVEQMGSLSSPRSSENLTLPVLQDRVFQLVSAIYKEMRRELYLYMPSAKLYEQEALFGTEVADRFPKANEEITAAGNCYSTGNYTACVFHLMRSVEVGARIMVRNLKVSSFLVDRNGQQIPVALCDWGMLVLALEKGVAALAAGTRTNLRRKQKYEFFNHALGSFRNFKDAWRNHVSHTRELYLPGQSTDIMDNTRQFMRLLATRLKE